MDVGIRLLVNNKSLRELDNSENAQKSVKSKVNKLWREKTDF
jgi:hypothetical protein